jgi:magnesium chelatase subunit D
VSGGVDPAAIWADAALAVELFAINPFAIGGITLRSWPGPPRDRVCTWLRDLLPAELPLLRLPLHITEDRLLGGLSLAATLRAGRVVAEQGLLARADGGAVVAAMAERLEPQVTSQLCAALDRGELSLERDGITAAIPCQIGVVALDEGLDDERTPAALRDRLAIHLDLSAVEPRSTAEVEPDRERVRRARALLPLVELSGSIAEALCQAALALGIASLRAPLLAAAVARAHAALDGRRQVEEIDAAAAARLVLGPRATQLPPPATDENQQEQSDPDPPAEPPPSPPPPDDQAGPEQPQQPERPDSSDSEKDNGQPSPPLDEIVLEAAKSAIPAGLLDALALGQAPRSAQKSAGQAGALRSSMQGGRPAGVRAGQPRSGERLNVIETLRASAAWQPLRRRERSAASLPTQRRVEIRKEDFRVNRFKQRTETCVIFCVDASGSAALQRLAEAKGAVEQVLVDCYVRRDQVALIAFRGVEASLLLSPTRSLVRVRRSLADLAGGGTTPLAAGIDAALNLALDARKRGQTPVLVLMTDGRGNVARAGREGRAAAEADALAGARAVREASVRTLFLDTSPRPRPPARLLATEMGARYMPLPYLDAAGISRQVQSLAEAP